MEYNWIPLTGEFTEKKGAIVFKGNQKEYKGQAGTETGAEYGELLFNKYFGGGTITTEVEFDDISETSTCEVILYYNASQQDFRVLTVGLSRPFFMFELREFVGGKWNILAVSGDSRNLRPKKKYRLAVTLKGSRVNLNVDGIDVLSGTLPFPIPQSQVGVWCQDYKDINIHSFHVETVKPKAFVVMEFSGHFNQLYQDVIKNICDEFSIEAVRADDSYSTGLIISDIVNQITESKLIIADISPTNPNVYYEVGYAHALNKPTILIAEKATKLPFDVSPFRVLFYENSINGKSKVEDGLRKHLGEILFK